MIKIHDNRATDERRLKNIELDGYFMLGDVLCRRVCVGDEFRWDEGIPIVEVASGRVYTLDSGSWVTQIRNEQIYVNIEDWG